MSLNSKEYNNSCAILDNIEDVVYVADPITYDLLYVNNTFKTNWGDNVIGKKCYQVLQNIDKPCAFCSNSEIFGKNLGNSYKWEFQNMVTHKWYKCVDKAIEWSNGNMVRFEIASDITEGKWSQIKLHEEETKFKSFFEHSIIGISITGIDGSLMVNEAFAKMLGYSIKDLLNLNWKEITHPDDIDKSSNVVADMIKGKIKHARYNKRYLHKRGSVVWTEITTVLQHDINGKPSYFITTINDITKEKANNLKLLESEKRYRILFENMPIGWAKHESKYVNGKPVDYKFLEANGTFEQFTGLKKENIIGKYVTEVISGIEKAKPNLIEAYGNIAKKLGIEHFEIFFEPFNKWYKITAFSKEKGHFVTILEDITDRKKYENKIVKINEELKRSNQELEQFAYVASHDLQEPLRMISSYAQLLEKKYYDVLDEKAKTYIYYAVDGAKRMQGLINDLLEFSRVTTKGNEFEVVDSHEVLGIVLSNLSKVIDETNTIVTNDKLPILYADSTQIVRVFQNLISNAIKFRNVNEIPHIHLGVEKKNKKWIFSIQDNGIGIDEKYKDKIFVIFQRLHSQKDYPGTGIGLAICKRIVNRHGGEIWFDSEPGKGSFFYFSIPD